MIYLSYKKSRGRYYPAAALAKSKFLYYMAARRQQRYLCKTMVNA